jgi:hypothetical protein
MTRIELAFPDRQSGPFTRWEHGQLVRSTGFEPARSSHCALNAARLPFPPRAHELGLEDEAGFEPARGSWARRVKRPMPSTAWLLVHVLEDPGGFEPRAHGLKVRSISSQV